MPKMLSLPSSLRSGIQRISDPRQDFTLPSTSVNSTCIFAQYVLVTTVLSNAFIMRPASISRLQWQWGAQHYTETFATRSRHRLPRQRQYVQRRCITTSRTGEGEITGDGSEDLFCCYPLFAVACHFGVGIRYLICKQADHNNGISLLHFGEICCVQLFFLVVETVFISPASRLGVQSHGTTTCSILQDNHYLAN